MWPTLYEVGPPGRAVEVHTYGLLVMLGFVAAFGVAHARGRRVGLPLDALVACYMAAAVGGLTGARVLYAVAVGDMSALYSTTGGFAYYGGVLGGAVSVWTVGRLRGLDLWKLADVAVPSVILGNAVGRMGCFFAGCCHGAPVHHPEPRSALLPDGLLGGQIWWHPHFPFVSTEFHTGIGRYLHEPLYPTQLWQSFGALAVFGVLALVWSSRRFDGQVTAAALVLEPIVRFIVEIFRADRRGYVWSWPVDSVPSWLDGLARAGGSVPEGGGDLVVGLTTSQGIGLASMCAGLVIWWLQREAGVAPEEPVEDVWVDELADVDL